VIYCMPKSLAIIKSLAHSCDLMHTHDSMHGEMTKMNSFLLYEVISSRIVKVMLLLIS
jgi:hypothetical protein